MTPTPAGGAAGGPAGGGGPPDVGGTRVARNAVLNLTALASPLVVAFLTLPVLIGGLGTERFGILAIAWMLLTYLSELGLGSTTTRYAGEAVGAGRTAEVGAIAWTTAALQAGVGLLEGVAVAALTPWLVGRALAIPPELAAEARACLYLLAVSIPLLSLGKSFRGLVEAAQRFDLATIVHLPLTAGTYVLAAIGAALGWSLPAVFAVIIAARVVSLPAYLVAARRALPGVSLRPAVHRRALPELVGFAGWVAVSTVVSPILVYLDRFLVGVLLTMTAVTFYTAPYEVVARLALIPAGVVGALYPAFSQRSGARDRARAEHLAARSVNLVAVVLGPVLVLAVAGAADGLTVWLGPEYAERSALALRILAVGVLANAAAHVPFGLLQSMGRPDLPARFHLLELPLQAVLAWVLVSRFGIPGAALAWTARMVLDAGLLFAAASRTGVLRAGALREAGLPRTLGLVAAAGVVGVGLVALTGEAAARWALLATITAATAAALWMLAVPAHERRRILALASPGSGRAPSR